jgi:hypothetical protein
VSATGASAAQVDTLGSTLSSTSRGLWALADGTSTTRVLVDTTAISAVRAAAFLDVLAPGAALFYDMSGGSMAIADGGPNRAAFDLLAEEGQADILLDGVTVTTVNATGILVGRSRGLRRAHEHGELARDAHVAHGVVHRHRGGDVAGLHGHHERHARRKHRHRRRRRCGRPHPGSSQAGSTTCVNAEDNASAGVTASYTMGQTAGTFQFTGWNPGSPMPFPFPLTTNLIGARQHGYGRGTRSCRRALSWRGPAPPPTAVTPL